MNHVLFCSKFCPKPKSHEFFSFLLLQGVFKDGTQVATKCLSAESKQGTDEFLTEIKMISNTRHPNLVELVGCCVENNNRILVYAYLENNSLARVLLGECCLSSDLGSFVEPIKVVATVQDSGELSSF